MFRADRRGQAQGFCPAIKHGTSCSCNSLCSMVVVFVEGMWVSFRDSRHHRLPLMLLKSVFKSKKHSTLQGKNGFPLLRAACPAANVV